MHQADDEVDGLGRVQRPVALALAARSADGVEHQGFGSSHKAYIREVSNFPDTNGGLRERNKAERRERILDAARALLREGPDRLTAERVAERAGVAPATVYNLVGRREKVWEALGGWFTDELDRRLRASTETDPLDRAREVVRVTVDLFAEDPLVARGLFGGWQESGVVLRGSPATHVRSALEDARGEGLLRADVDTGALASVVASACVGLLHQWAAGILDDARLRTLVRRAADVAIAAGAADGHRDRLESPLRRRTRA